MPRRLRNKGFRVPRNRGKTIIDPSKRNTMGKGIPRSAASRSRSSPFMGKTRSITPASKPTQQSNRRPTQQPRRSPPPQSSSRRNQQQPRYRSNPNQSQPRQMQGGRSPTGMAGFRGTSYEQAQGRGTFQGRGSAGAPEGSRAARRADTLRQMQQQRNQEDRVARSNQLLEQERRRKAQEAARKKMLAEKKAKAERERLKKEKLAKQRKERLAKQKAKAAGAGAKKPAIRYADKKEVKKDINKFKANLAKGLTARGKKISSRTKKAMSALDAKLAKQKANAAAMKKMTPKQQLQAKLKKKGYTKAYYDRIRKQLAGMK